MKNNDKTTPTALGEALQLRIRNKGDKAGCVLYPSLANRSPQQGK
jgi:hypothetical protein